MFQSSHNKKHHNKKHHNKKYPILKILIGSIIFVLVLLGVGFLAIFENVKTTFDSSYSNMQDTTSISFKKDEPFTILFIEAGSSNSTHNICYTAILTSINPKTKQTTFMNFPVSSILPNNKTVLEEYNKYGIDGITKMIKQLLKIDINKVVSINTDNIGNLVSATGGITIANNTAFNSNNFRFNQGTIFLQSNEQVQAYIKPINAQDFNNSITRLQNVSMAIYDNFRTLANTSKKIENINFYRSILYSLYDVIKMNITFNEAEQILFNYHNAFINTSKLNLHIINSNQKEIVTWEELNNNKQLFLKSLK